MSAEKNLQTYLPVKGINIISGYRGEKLLVYVAMYELAGDNSLRVSFPKGHQFSENQTVNLHLDNRTGVDDFDLELRVIRSSYKGRVISTDSMTAMIAPLE